MPSSGGGVHPIAYVGGAVLLLQPRAALLRAQLLTRGTPELDVRGDAALLAQPQRPFGACRPLDTSPNFDLLIEP